MKNSLDRKGNVKCKFAGLEQMKVKVLVNIVEMFLKKEAVQVFIRRCFSLCLQLVKNSDL